MAWDAEDDVGYTTTSEDEWHREASRKRRYTQQQKEGRQARSQRKVAEKPFFLRRSKSAYLPPDDDDDVFVKCSTARAPTTSLAVPLRRSRAILPRAKSSKLKRSSTRVAPATHDKMYDMSRTESKRNTLSTRNSAANQLTLPLLSATSPSPCARSSTSSSRSRSRSSKKLARLANDSRNSNSALSPSVSTSIGAIAQTTALVHSGRSKSDAAQKRKTM